MSIVQYTKELQDLRKIPQFLFFGPIHFGSMQKVRKEVIAYCKANPNTKDIDFIINSPGGSPDDAYRIIRTLRNNFERVNVVVPFWAKSAATLLSLGATKIIMGEFGEFGPLDIQIGVERDDSPEMDLESALNDEYSVRRIEARAQELYVQMFASLYSRPDVKIGKTELSNQILKYLASFYEPLLTQINPYSLGKKKRLLDIGNVYADRILLFYNKQLPTHQRNAVVDFLVNQCPDHGYAIDYQIISLFLKNVQTAREVGDIYNDILQKITTELLTLRPDEEFVRFLDRSFLPSESNQSFDQTVDSDTTNTSNNVINSPEHPNENPETKQENTEL